MSIADSMRLLWVGGLTDCTGSRSWTTDKLLQPANTTVTSVGANDVSLYVGNAKHSIQYFAHEADRFASASFESLLTGAKNMAYPRSTAWLLIRGYYAAFFSVHALMRLHGWACTRLTSANLKEINNGLSIFFPGSERLGAGLYLLKSESGGRELRCQHLDSSIGGTHEILWSLLRGYLDEVSNIVLANPSPDGQVLVVAIYDFLKLVDGYGGPKWFATVRNRLNYGHEYGAWFPYIKSTCDYDRVHAVFASWTSSPEMTLAIGGKDELIRFASACTFLVSACCATIRDLTYRSKPRSPFRQSCGLLTS
jgi:hypothetical protein